MSKGKKIYVTVFDIYIFDAWVVYCEVKTNEMTSS